MTNYRKKSAKGEAMQYTKTNGGEIERWAGGYGGPVQRVIVQGGEFLRVYTRDGEVMATVGDWILKEVITEFSSCKPHVFREGYEIVEKVDG